MVLLPRLKLGSTAPAGFLIGVLQEWLYECYCVFKADTFLNTMYKCDLADPFPAYLMLSANFSPIF